MSEQAAGQVRTSGLATTLTRRRQFYGLVVAAVAPPLLTAVLLLGRTRPGLDTVLLTLVLASVAASAVGGILPAVLATVVSGGLANFFFAVPYGTFIVASEAEAADLVIFLSRPEYYDKDTPDKNVCDVIITKQRNGPTGRFSVGWSGETTRFSDLAQVPEGAGM